MIETNTSNRPVDQSASGWSIVGMIRNLLQRFHSAARALPDQAWLRWLRVLLIGLALTCLVALGLTPGARWWQPRGMQAWDEATLAVILEQAPMSFAQAIVFETPGNLIGMGLLIGAVTVLGIYAGRPLVVASIFSAYTMGSAIF